MHFTTCYCRDSRKFIFGEYLVGTAPRGGEDIMHLEKPSLARYLNDPNNHGYAVLLKIFFPPTSTGARQL